MKHAYRILSSDGHVMVSDETKKSVGLQIESNGHFLIAILTRPQADELLKALGIILGTFPSDLLGKNLDA